MSLMDDFEDDEAIVPVEVLPQKVTKAEERAIALRNMEDELLHQSMSVVQNILRFREIDPLQEEPPMAWRLECGGGPEGYEEAKKMYRLAQAAWLPASKAPVGFKYASAMAASIIKARSVERAAPTNLALQIIQMPAPPNFPEIIIPAEDP